MRLSSHFTLAEATKSQTAIRRGIKNSAPDHVVDQLVRVAENVLEPVRAEFGKPFSPSSWYRSPELNAAVGSKPTSDHPKGRAVDFEVPGVSNVDLARWCAESLVFDQLILEFYRPGEPASGWVHCAIPEEGEVPRGEVLTITRDGTKKGLPEVSNDLENR